MMLMASLSSGLCGPEPIRLPLPEVSSGARTLTITVPDIKGSYTIPYISGGDELRFTVQFPQGGPDRARLSLSLDGKRVGVGEACRERPLARFGRLLPGEYALRLEALDAKGVCVAAATWECIGVGTVFAALGDSITEGYHGHGFWRDDLNLRAEDFPATAVSRDGRNFPQYSPTTAWHRPDINCFQSWMTDLNNLLTQKWDRPCFIANEGYGGITTGAYLNTMRNDTGWQARMKLLRPTVWLIHLGVNDERAKLPAAEVAANLDAIVSILVNDYGAKPSRILIARPCYDYVEGGPEILKSYIAATDALIARRGLRLGPDFFAAYAVDKAKWYGDDPVHPNLAGMEYMAQLWADAIGTAALR
jgi:lysophospholipase L1-like esterase